MMTVLKSQQERLNQQQQQLNRLEHSLSSRNNDPRNVGDNSNTTGQGRDSIQCYACRKWGHKAFACPNKQQGRDNSQNRGAYPKQNTNIINKPAASTVKSRAVEAADRTQNGNIKQLVGTCPEIEALIGGQKAMCLIDTRSQVSTITEEFYSELLKEQPTIHDVTRWLKAKGANNLPIPYLGYIEVDLQISGQIIPSVGFLVVKSGRDGVTAKRPGLLGSNVFQLVSLLKAKSTSSDGSFEECQKLEGILQLYEMTTSIEKSSNPSFVRVAGRDLVKIPANSAKVVTCTTRQGKVHKYVAVVQAIQGNAGALPRNILVVDTYADVERGCLPVRVVKIGDEDVWLHAKGRIGILQDAEVLQRLGTNYEIGVTMQELQVTVCEIDVECQTSPHINSSDTELSNHLNLDKDALPDGEYEEFLYYNLSVNTSMCLAREKMT